MTFALLNWPASTGQFRISGLDTYRFREGVSGYR